jgi:hypothetical protein
MLNKTDLDAYALLLADWIKYSQDTVYPLEGKPGICHYGPGGHTHWGVHTNQKAFSAFAVAAGDPSIHWERYGLSWRQVMEQALGLLRYSLHTRQGGAFPCVDGRTWTPSWISVLGLDRMMHGVEAIEGELNDADKKALRKVFISEADWLLTEYAVQAGLTENNKPESNIWNANILLRTAMMYGDAPNAAQYIEKARGFYANGISIPQDKNDPELNGLFIGPNFTEQFGLNHHGYLNIGYMVICLSNLAMLHFSAKHHNWKLPVIIYHHAESLWRLVRSFTFGDGRLLRIGGDTRARYCYCQDYALPVWALAEDLWGEDCSSLEKGWLEVLKKESRANADGSFLSERLTFLEEQSPLYYTRLESDRANVISMLITWGRRFPAGSLKKSTVYTAWEDPFHGALYRADPERLASFVWNAAEKPQGFCLPPDDSSLAEWRRNLAGVVRGSGNVNEEEIGVHWEESFEGGFITSGYTVCYSDGFVAEGQTREDIARKVIAFAALPDGRTVLSIQYAVSLNRVYGGMIKGVYWHIPNDIWNNFRRFLTSQERAYTLRGGRRTVKETLPAGNWLNADGKLGLACSIPLVIVRNGCRQIGLKSQSDINGSLYTEEICSPYDPKRRWYEKDEILIDTAFAVQTGTAEETEALFRSLRTESTGPLRFVSVIGADGKQYGLVLNPRDKSAEFSCSGWTLLAGKKDLPAFGAALFVK